MMYARFYYITLLLDNFIEEFSYNSIGNENLYKNVYTYRVLKNSDSNKIVGNDEILFPARYLSIFI